MLHHYLAVALRNIGSAPLAFAMNVLTLAIGLACFVTVYAFVAFFAAGDRASRSYGVAVDPGFLELFELPFIAGDPNTALRNPRGVVLTKAHAEQLFGAEDPLGQALIVGNTVDATVTGVLDTVPEPSHLGRSTSASLKFDWLASIDVLEAIHASTAVPDRPPAPENWLEVSATTYMLLPADGSLTIDSLREQLRDFTRRHVPPELASFAALEHGARRSRHSTCSRRAF